MNVHNITKQFKGRLFILSAPSGTGKTTLCMAVRDRFADMRYSISYTTRPARIGEQNGVDYFFISTDEFRNRIQNNQWAEWAEVHGNYYGTSVEFINHHISAGQDILLDIDVQGALQLLQRYPDSVMIFIKPPSFEALRKRLELRGTDSRETIEKRLKNAQKEMEKIENYQHIIVNNHLKTAISELITIIEKYRLAK